MSQKITFGEALKKIFRFFIPSMGEEEKKKEKEPEPEDNRLDNDTQTNANEMLMCPRCKTTYELIHDITMDFIHVMYLRCPNCFLTDEYDYDDNTGLLLKRVTVFDKFQNISSGYMEAITDLNFNHFALDALWEVDGNLCFPMLCKTQFSDTVDLVFVKVGTDISFRNSLEGFILTDNDIIGRVLIERDEQSSYFCVPYVSHLPFYDYAYVTTPSIRHELLCMVYPIRYMHKVTSRNEGLLDIHELSFIEDFPRLGYGLEVYTKFITYDMNTTEIVDLIKKIDLKNIILDANSIDVNSDYSLRKHKVTKIGDHFLTGRTIEIELRKRFYDDIIKFVKLLKH